MALGKFFGGPKPEKEKWKFCTMLEVRKGDYVKADRTDGKYGEVEGVIEEEGWDDIGYEQKMKYIIVKGEKITNSGGEIQRRV